MNRTYYFADETSMFRQPAQPEVGQPVRLRIQTAKADFVHVWLIHGTQRLPMKPVELRGECRIFEITVTPKKNPYSYYYEIVEEQQMVPGEIRQVAHKYQTRAPKHRPAEARKASSTYYYDKRGIVAEPEKNYEFKIRPGYVVPEWLQGAVMYQIFTDRFCDGENRNDVQDREYIYVKQPVERVKDWSSIPHQLDVGRFYGGDLPGICEKLDYLQNLGVQVLYLNPIFVSPSNHKYDSQDYDNVDPHLTRILHDGGDLLPAGAKDNTEASRYRQRVTDPENLAASNQYFAEFVEELHRRGMKIILDGVFNHCGSFHRWFDLEELYVKDDTPEEEKGAYLSKESKYRNFFKFESDGKYEAWWDVKTLPKLNFEDSPELQEEILRIAAKWLSPPYNIDGWRLDVAADLGHSLKFNHEFWQRFRDTVKSVNPNAVILAEHYGDVSPWLQGDEWDTVMNYDAFMEPVTWFLTGMEKHSDSYRADLDGNAEAFWNTMEQNMAKFTNGACYGAMNQLDNHDHSRFITRTNRKVGRLASVGASAAAEGVNYGILRQAVIIQMTWPGAPTLYYGDETGVCGWTDPDSRRTYPWGKEDWQLIEFYKYAIGMHRHHSAFRTGSLAKLYSGDGMIAYGRFDMTEQMVVIVNTRNYEQHVSLDLSVMGVGKNAHWKRIMQTTAGGYNVGRIDLQLRDRILDVKVPAGSAVVFRNATQAEIGKGDV